MNINDFCTAIENVFISKKDYVQNFDKWKPGSNNILYITGFSGSGKSTLAQEYVKKYNAIIIELDMFEFGNDFSGIGILNKCKNKFPDYKKGLEANWKNADGTEMDEDEIITLLDKAAKYALKICKNDKSHLYIFEGLQIFRRFDPDSIKSSPLIIKGTSALLSEFRAIKRGIQYNKNKKNKSRDIDIIKRHIKSHLPMNLKDDAKIKSFQNKITHPNIESAFESAFTNTNKIVKSTKHYCIKDNDGNVISKADYYDFSKKDFDWILICNVKTKPEFRGKGLATEIMKSLCTDLLHKYPSKGLYLLVRVNNTNAIALYKKIKFKILKEYEMKDGPYYIMYKGNADKQQLTNMNFR